MKRPETQYARSGSISIAYQVSGGGPYDLVWTPGIVSHLDLDWEWPPRARFLEQLGSFSRVIRFDKRGTGLSDRPTNAATLEERVDDIRAVMDAARSKTASLLGFSDGGSMACLYAAMYPDRTKALLLWGVQARWTKAPDYPWGPTPEEMRSRIRAVSRTGVTLEYLKGTGLGVGSQTDPAFLDWYIRYAQAAASPTALAALETMCNEIDIRGILPGITVPTLVMNRSGDPMSHVDAARDLASQIPGAMFREWPGDTHMMFDIADQVSQVIQEFVTGSKPTPSGDRVFAAILFVDIADSTSRLGALGDSGWRNLLRQAEEEALRSIASFRGRLVKSTGDGFLATFDGPTRAIQCARDVRGKFRSLGLETRAGLHAGECEILGDDVTGIAVHLAARIQQAATPGEILASATLRDLVAGSGLQLEDRGTLVLKGIPGSQRLFVVE
jgi:class 3 adenylate cyclase